MNYFLVAFYFHCITKLNLHIIRKKSFENVNNIFAFFALNKKLIRPQVHIHMGSNNVYTSVPRSLHFHEIIIRNLLYQYFFRTRLASFKLTSPSILKNRNEIWSFFRCEYNVVCVWFIACLIFCLFFTSPFEDYVLLFRTGINFDK
jgi:hypothetical protein